jgi:putative transposase
LIPASLRKTFVLYATRACELLKDPRTAFYTRRTGKPGPRAVRDAEPAKKIAEVHQNPRGTHGASRAYAVPQRDFAPDPDGLNTRWCGDIVYVPTQEGRGCQATVIDIASRSMVGWSTADHPRTELVADALRSTCRRRRPTGPLIFHSDRGCQYASQHFTTIARKLGIHLPAGRTGQCWNNPLTESFFATIERESLDTSSWPSRAAPHTTIFDFIEGRHNVRQRHSGLGYRSPAEYETAQAATTSPLLRPPSPRRRI